MRSKALLLLFIFMLNTVTGFSCALHMSRDNHYEAVESHEHYHAAVKHEHHQLLPGQTTIGADEPCCQSAVNNFILLAKLVPSADHLVLKLPLFYTSNNLIFSLLPDPGVIMTPRIVIDERQRPPTRNIYIMHRSLLI
jgi:hypothetical protein